MVFLEYFLNNYVMIFELIGLLIMLRISAHVSARMKRLTIAVIILLLIESALFRIEAWAGNLDALTVARPILTSFIYSIYPVILVLAMRITSSKELSRKNLFFVLIPQIVCIPIYFSSQWTKIVFWYTETNDYQTGPLYRLPYVIFGLYILIFLIHNITFFKKYSRFNRLVAIYIVSGSILGVIVYLAFDFSNEYNALFSSALVLYYLCIYIHMAKIDPLTQLLNRQSYYQDMKAFDDRITGVVSVDMNELKYINDNMGHEAGDTALKTVSHVLWENCGKNGTVYRVGGDEFMIFYLSSSEDDVKAAVDVMKSRMAKTDYVCAFGYAMKARGDDIEAVIRESDEKMYADKAKTKRERAEKAATE